MALTVQRNDIHSQLNPVLVAEVVRPTTIGEIAAVIKLARSRNMQISIAGGRHSMGAQQFGSNTLHIDITAMNKVLSRDAERGLIELEAGADWPLIIAATHEMPSHNGARWAIRQKQTGVDNVTIAGSISSNCHGRGLLMQPIAEDVEELTIVLESGEAVKCSRAENAELFSLVIGGYGLFGVIASVKLRLSPRQKLKRVVNIIDIDDAANAAYRRVDEGCVFGDFQYAIDHEGEEFLKRGVLACYKPVDPATPLSPKELDLPPDVWLKLLKLAHDDKKQAFKLYAQHYLQTDGQIYWSDTMQLSTYIPTYAEFLEKALPQHDTREISVKETLVIGEHYVPPDKSIDFISSAREILRKYATEVIYGTIRVIQQDRTSFLPWAKRDYCCVIFNLRTAHNPEGVERTANTFRCLTDASAALGGSFFLTYHRFATAEQVERCYPQIRDFFKLKKRYDPEEIFVSDWYRHYRKAFSGDQKTG